MPAEDRVGSEVWEGLDRRLSALGTAHLTAKHATIAASERLTVSVARLYGARVFHRFGGGADERRAKVRTTRRFIAGIPIIAASILQPEIASGLEFAISNSEMVPCFDDLLCVDVAATLTGTTGFASVSYPLPLPVPDPLQWIPVAGMTFFNAGMGVGGVYPTELVRERESLMGFFTEVAEFRDSTDTRFFGGGAQELNVCPEVPPTYSLPIIICYGGNGGANFRSYAPADLGWSQGPLDIAFTFAGEPPLPIPGTEYFTVDTIVEASVTYYPRPDPAQVSFEIVNSDLTACEDGLLCARTLGRFGGTADFGSHSFTIPVPVPDPNQWTAIEASISFSGGMPIKGVYLADDVRARQGPPNDTVLMGVFSFHDNDGNELSTAHAVQTMLCGHVPDGYLAPTFACADGNAGYGFHAFGPGQLAWTQQPVDLRVDFSSTPPLPIPGTERFALDYQGVEISVKYTSDEDGDGIPNQDDTCRSVANADQADADDDGRGDVCDNCASTPNPDQADRGGIGSSEPDGIGDDCQCGDANGNGSVTVADAALIQRSLLRPPTASMAKPNLCDVGGSKGCTPSDAAIVMRALLSPPRAQVTDQCTSSVP